MTAASFFRDLAAFSVQIAIVVVVVAVLLRVIRIPARARYVCLRLTLLACLVVPWALRSVVVVTEVPVGAAASQRSLPNPATASAAPAQVPVSSTGTGQPRMLADVPWATLGLVALIVGVTARAIWLAIGFFRLGQLTRRAVPVESVEYARLQEQLRTAATISEVDRLAQPVTFGSRRPVVLLPDSLAAAPPALRRAVVTHELLHVRRGDWLSLLGEEAVRTALWFHPAIHWLTSSIQLAREEMVDELTVRATGDRRAYMQALLAFADTSGLRAAPAFAHRRQLFHRILTVSKEKVMSVPRIVTSVAALAIGVSAAIWNASSAFPILTASRIELPAVAVPPIDDGWLIAEPQFVTVAAAGQRAGAAATPQAPRPVTPENPIPRRTRGLPPVPPQGARDAQVIVSARVTLDREGAVTSVERDACHGSADACPAFFDATATAIRQWRYDRPAQAPLQFYVLTTFRPGQEPAVVQTATTWLDYVRETQESLRLLAQETGGIAIVNQDDFNRQLRALNYEHALAEAVIPEITELSNGLRELERALRLALERGADTEELTKYRQTLALLNDELAYLQRALARTGARSSEISEAAARLAQAGDALRAARAAQERDVRDARVRAVAERGLSANQLPLVAPSGKTPMRVGDTIEERPRILQRTKPEYSADAMAARVEGVVVLEVLVDEEGRVGDARVVRSIPLLDESALTAIRQWRFTPTRLKGEPVPVIVQVEMNFTLK